MNHKSKHNNKHTKDDYDMDADDDISDLEQNGDIEEEDEFKH
eukprot:CAMPEP_0201581114 /NCGR_PEP_ID=MMETSP0190_2-20130828/63051_1 /ASSEMBLY_ACC=CAM_ASM_000263 /TAXON_ID=37353 /ORGANISM="Rosalina sp." /LENGTH=41 /DNA_ID= /DNA_START= /DNA_END= /DNA_ORIENTATION=